MDVRFIAAGVGLLLLAAFQHGYLTPRLERVPADYASEASYNATARARDSASAPWVASTLVARRVDQMLVASAAHGILQGDMHWTDASGQVAYETSAVFGIDRSTRENLPGYGDTVRTGPFLFPVHTEKKSYRYWDTQFIGHCEALFQHEARLGDLTVYVFSFTARQLDETDGYDHLPDVPERFRVLTDAHGTLWIEPTSGVVVDYVEEGVSYLVNAASGQRVANVSEWKDRYTPQSLADKRRLAQSQRTRIRVLEIWLPGALGGAGALALLLGWRRRAPTTVAASEGQA
ncbi:MAG: porin PorA family protein [Telluria sp.]